MIVGSVTQLDACGYHSQITVLFLSFILFTYFRCTRFEAFIPGKSVLKIWITLCIPFAFIYL